MAVVLIFRLAVAVSPVVVRACATNACDANLWANTVARFYGRILDSTEDPDELSSDMTAAVAVESEGGSVHVTDFDGTFEMRKLQIRWSRTPPAGPVQDVDVCTFHFLKTASGVPTDSWDTSDYTTLETAIGTWFAGIKTLYPSWVHLDQFRWYADGPAFYTLSNDGSHYVPIGDNPARRVTETDVAGTGSGEVLPPQAALTVSEITSSRKHWGRFYLPGGISATLMGSDGRADASIVDAVMSPTVVWYNAARAAHLIPVVFSIQKPSRPTARGGTLPAVGAQAFEITSIQIDDLVDVVRRRRYDTAVYKPRTALT